MLIVAIRMPSFGARFAQNGNAIVATLRDGRTIPLSADDHIVIAGKRGRLVTSAGTLVPDYMPTGDRSAVRAWYEDRDRIGEIANGPGASITLPKDRTSIVAPLSRGPTRLSALSLDVWLLAIQAVAIGLLGIGLRIARPRDRRAWIFGFSCDGIFLAALSGAVFDARELTADGNLLQIMQGLNFIGSNLCAFGLAALFFFVPRDLVPLWVAKVLLGAAVIAGVLEGIGLIPRYGFYVGLMIGLAIFLCALGIQWNQTRSDPVARSILRWVGAWAFIGTAILCLGMVAPIMLGVAPLASDGLSIVPVALVYGGIGFGVAGLRVFEIDRWVYRLFLGATATVALLVADAILVTTLELTQPVALALALLGIGYLYFPARAWLWRRSRGNIDLSSDALFRQATVVVFAAEARERRDGWRKLLDRVFEPLEISRSERDVDDAVVTTDGEGLIISRTADEGPLLLRFAGRGRRVFGASELRTAHELVAMIREAERARDEYGRGVVDERQRLARDLHDDVSAHLLSGLHRREVGLVRDDIRHALAEIRTMVASLSGPSLSLASAIADIRYECAERLSAAGIALDWEPLTGDAADDQMLDYGRHKALVSSMREVVSNIVKHANATRCTVDMVVGECSLRLCVSDDGRNSASVNTRAPAGHGLANIDHRVRGIGGRFSAAPCGNGFRVVMELPLSTTTGAAA